MPTRPRAQTPSSGPSWGTALPIPTPTGPHCDPGSAPVPARTRSYRVVPLAALTSVEPPQGDRPSDRPHPVTARRAPLYAPATPVTDTIAVGSGRTDWFAGARLAGYVQAAQQPQTRRGRRSLAGPGARSDDDDPGSPIAGNPRSRGFRPGRLAGDSGTR
ncbi:hypothetical protein GCM10009664_37280 [Kitasatospora gansuensis]